jgi:hypothetical protein
VWFGCAFHGYRFLLNDGSIASRASQVFEARLLKALKKQFFKDLSSEKRAAPGENRHCNFTPAPHLGCAGKNDPNLWRKTTPICGEMIGAAVSDILERVQAIKFISVMMWLLGAAWGQNYVHGGDFEGNPAAILANSKLEIKVTTKGSTLASVTLVDDAEKLNPLWNPIRMARELGRPAAQFDGGAGVFVCVDGFGPVSKEERAAGLPGHGEAHTEVFSMHPDRQGATTVVTMTATLPLVEENFTRTFKLNDGENVVLVESELENLLGFDRPVNWAEHATIGSPFLEPGVTVVDFSGTRSQTRPYTGTGMKDAERRLVPGKDFAWPTAPSLDGSTVNLRETPAKPHFLDHATTLLDPSREVEWVTAINAKKGLLIGYIFKRSDYPWLQYWGFYPATEKMARGMEFGTQPYDVPRREAISMGKMFDTPTYRWLPAKAKIQARFLMFYTKIPAGFQKVDEVILDNGAIVISDHNAGRQVKLVTSQKL